MRPDPTMAGVRSIWRDSGVERQAIDQTHRIGQNKPILAYRLVATETMEKTLMMQEENGRDVRGCTRRRRIPRLAATPHRSRSMVLAGVATRRYPVKTPATRLAGGNADPAQNSMTVLRG